ncbi:hypothetical protein ABBQ32_011757 [Trebouxia sp. C0010 RCD-2024]
MTASHILIFHHPSSRSVRIVWLCDELGLKYDVDVIKDLKEIKTDEYKQKNPNGLLPAVKIEGEFYYESGAIMQIILERFANGNLMPAANKKQRGKFLQWMWFLEATFTPHLSELHHHKMVLPDDKKVPEVIPYEQEVAGQRMQVVEDQLSKTHYLLGDEFTAVDVVCGQVLTLAEEMEVMQPRSHPASIKYLEEMKARPGYAKAVAH